MKIIGIIPARLGSTRLEEKVLKPIQGRPMIEWVWRQAQGAKKLSQVIVACDDERIAQCIESCGGVAVLTSKDHPNGSSRIAEVAKDIDAEVFLNIQGDEPTIHPESIDLLATAFLKEASLEVATLAVRFQDAENHQNPNVVKVVCDGKGDALYFSRSPIPHVREPQENLSFLKHLGIYGYKKNVLLDYVSQPQSQLEIAEKLEQLRFLERGIKIRVLETKHDSLGVDTLEDLKAAELKLEKCKG